MKKSLMAAAAATALLAGAGFAYAQDTRGNSPEPQMNRGNEARPQPNADQPGAQRNQENKNGSGEERAKPRTEQRTQGRSDQRSTTGQSTTDQDRGSNAQQDRQERRDQRNVQERQEQRNQPSAQDRDRRDAPGRNGARTETRGGGSVSLSTEQKTRIRTTVIQSGPKVTNVNFSLNVGTVVPRSVQMVAVPPTLIEIYPSWRGYMYFIVGDEIVVIDPDTLRIVAVLDV